jgi:hypothetical protein
MAKRILPYRDYSEHDVVNLFALDVDGATLSSFVSNGSGDFDAGVVVQVAAGALPGDAPSTLSTSGNLRDYLGASFNGSHVGFNAYPSNGMTVAPADADTADKALGITLRETLAFDENGEKMLYYKQKLDEAQGVLPGQAVPVLTKGTVLLTAAAFEGAPALNDNLVISSVAGKLAAEGTASAGTVVVGKVIATGTDTSDSSTKFLCKISF